ncbi:PKD domain-containing protein [Crocinitomix sp.]|nr:PKD domain-containing protein [Crocinitomix sp.]
MSCKKVPPAPLPDANFFVANNNCTAICSLYFYDESKNAVKWRWDFGNGTTSTKENDTINYITSGDFEVWLYVWNSDEIKDSVRKTVSIN